MARARKGCGKMQALQKGAGVGSVLEHPGPAFRAVRRRASLGLHLLAFSVRSTGGFRPLQTTGHLHNIFLGRHNPCTRNTRRSLLPLRPRSERPRSARLKPIGLRVRAFHAARLFFGVGTSFGMGFKGRARAAARISCLSPGAANGSSWVWFLGSLGCSRRCRMPGFKRL